MKLRVCVEVESRFSDVKRFVPTRPIFSWFSYFYFCVFRLVSCASMNVMFHWGFVIVCPDHEYLRGDLACQKWLLKVMFPCGIWSCVCFCRPDPVACSVASHGSSHALRDARRLLTSGIVLYFRSESKFTSFSHSIVSRMCHRKLFSNDKNASYDIG